MSGKSTNFTQWLIESHSNQKSPIGSLAQHARTDQTWPTDAKTEREVLSYLHRTVATDSIIRACKAAWQIYRVLGA